MNDIHGQLFEIDLIILPKELFVCVKQWNLLSNSINVYLIESFEGKVADSMNDEQ